MELPIPAASAAAVAAALSWPALPDGMLHIAVAALEFPTLPSLAMNSWFLCFSSPGAVVTAWQQCALHHFPSVPCSPSWDSEE